MPFDLKDYEPVEDRLRAFWEDHPRGRVTTALVHNDADGYIVKASVWREPFQVTETYSSVDIDGTQGPDATGYAQEAVTEKGVNSTSALENCETSAIGRALANLGYAAKGKRPSREEMSKSAPAMGASADAGGRVDTESSASRESSGSPGVAQPARAVGQRGEATAESLTRPSQKIAGSSPAPGGTGASSEGTTAAYGEGVTDPSTTPEPGEGSAPFSPSPGKGIFPLDPHVCDHKTKTGRWLPTRQLNGLPVCPRCGASAVIYRESVA